MYNITEITTKIMSSYDITFYFLKLYFPIEGF